MKKLIKILAAAITCVATLSLVACGGGGNAIDNNPEKPVTGDSKILVAYFSWSGNTQQLANWVAEKSDGELFRIVPEEAYASDSMVVPIVLKPNCVTEPVRRSHRISKRKLWRNTT